MQSSFFGCAQPCQLSFAEGQIEPSLQHCGPAHMALVPGHSTGWFTAQCLPLGGGGGGGGGTGGPGGGGSGGGDGGVPPPPPHPSVNEKSCET